MNSEYYITEEVNRNVYRIYLNSHADIIEVDLMKAIAILEW